MLEIQYQTDTQFADAEVIKHLSALAVSDLFDDLRIHNDLAEGNEVRHKFANALAFVQNLETSLLIESDSAQFEFDGKRVLVALLVQRRAKLVHDRECA